MSELVSSWTDVHVAQVLFISGPTIIAENVSHFCNPASGNTWCIRISRLEKASEKTFKVGYSTKSV
jgi:hypothetical protein